MGVAQPHERSLAAGVSAAVKTLAVTDLVDSTGLFARLGDRRAAEVSARHERLARDLVVRCSGREIDKTDGFLLLFDRAVDAVRFALAYHRALADLADEEGVELDARVGIHLGDVILRANPPEDVARGAKPLEIEGYAKPIAARVMGLAKGRQTLLTRGAFDLARQAAAREPVADGPLRWLAHGPYALKGIAEPVEVFEVGETGFAPLLVPKSTAKARRAVAAGDEITLGWRPAPGLEIPRRPHWWLAEKLGEGGFGEVWRAAHEKTGENRVFKFCYSPDRLRSLQREVTLFRLLKESLGTRDDIARILDWNFDEAPYFLEVEYTEGGNLLEWVAEQGGPEAVPLATKLELVAQVADALAAAHSVGVLHKDVKPSNVLVTTGRDGRPEVRLTDFGIGLVTDREALARQGITVFDLTEMVAESTGSAGGTHLYMAPELVEGRTATVQADIYALGVMLYQFVAGDFTRALASGWRRDVPDEVLQEDVAALVDGRPERRMRDAQQVAERLRSVEERRARREAERREAEEREAERRALERAHRRRKLALAVAAASVAVLVVVSFLALQAIDARREAERRRGQAEGLIGFMVGDLREKLEPIGRLDILDEVGNQAIEYFEAVPEADLSDEELFQRSEALFQIGEVRMERGQLTEAMQAHEDSLELALRLVSRDRENAEWKRLLAAGHFGVGRMLYRGGELDDALEHFQAYLQLAEELLAMEPENPQWKLEVAYGLSNIGSAHEARGDLPAAREAFEKSLELRRRLAGAAPRNPEWVYGLAVAHNKLGVVLDALGHLEEALENFESDLALTSSLIVESPHNAELRHHEATARSFMAHLLLALGQTRAASDHATTGLAIVTDLSSADPSNTRWRRNLGALHQQAGAIQLALGDPDRALDEFLSARDLFEELVAMNPNEAGWRRGLVKAHLGTGESLLRLGRTEPARQELAEVDEFLAPLGTSETEDADLAMLSSRAHRLSGMVHQAQGQPMPAAREWNAAEEIIAPFARGSSDRALLAEWSMALLLLGRDDEARALVSRLLDMGYREPEFIQLCQRKGLCDGEERAAHRSRSPQKPFLPTDRPAT